MLLLATAFATTVRSQKEIQTSDTCRVFGQVEQPVSWTIEDMAKIPSEKIGDVKITNHLGEFKKIYRDMRGIPIKLVLDKVKIRAENPKDLSAFFFVFRATDGYCNVYSWNEIYNTALGDQVFIVTAYKNQNLATMPERILAVSARDTHTGRRLLKGLASIEVRKVD